MAQANVKLTVDATSATRALNGVQNKTNKLQKSFNGLRTAIAATGITLLARQAVNTSANFEKLNVRLGLLTKESGSFAKSQKIAADAQKAFGLSATEALEGVTDITARLAPLKVGVEDIRTVFFGFNTAAKLAGASTIEASNAFRQLAQALGSGRLAGDEFRSVSEQVPTVLAPIAAELGVNIGKLKELAAEGALTSDVVLRALGRVGKDGAGFLKELLKNDPTQVFKNFTNATEDLSRAIGSQLRPVVENVTVALTNLVQVTTNLINSSAGQASIIIAGSAIAVKALTVAVPAATAALTALIAKLQFAAVNSALAATGLKGAAAAAFVAAGGIGKMSIALVALKTALAATGIGAAIVVLGGLITKIIEARKEQEKFNEAIQSGSIDLLKTEFNKLFIERQKILRKINENEGTSNKKVLNSLKKQLATNTKNLEPIKEQLKLQIENNKQLKINTETKKTNKKIEEEINQLIKDNLAKAIAQEQAEMDAVAVKGKIIDQLSKERALAQAALDGNLEQVKTQQEINALVEIAGEGMRDIITAYIEGTEALKKQKTEADILKDKFDEIGLAIETSIKDNLTDAITGAQSFGDAMIGVLNKIRDRIIANQLDKLLGNFGSNFSSGARGGERTGLGGFIGGVLGGLLGKQNGGPVQAGRPYIVGERQPELFVPRTSGTILPSVPAGGGSSVVNNITINVDSSGNSNDNGMNDSAFARQLVTAVQSVIINEQRVGGLLS